MKRWKITIEYRGSDYYGWQKQPDVPSIQGAIEEALKKFCQQEINVHAAGRTDAGVHARGQVAHFDLDYGDRPLEGYDLLKAINAHLRPQPISIIGAEEVSENFQARFDAKNKLYNYRIINRPGFLALEEGLAWQVKRPLDVAAMHEAAQRLLGNHDFTTFRDGQCQAKSPERTLDRLDVTARPYDETGGVEILVEAEAMSFLHHMVRNMVGTLALVGEGKWSADDVSAALAARDRVKGGPTAPADGLYLMRVDY
ncbi:MAG: tRNA pseudouridine(38-40) synthase TruA [Alphaproteobacteria bacterium]|nr:tRNA pseudouridine(38-40) synthase TruA [Alphaproteobacteria bacterium]